ncbi:tetratricopeptide repeat protein [Novosphingobium tardum]|uniref:Tetratricopeptide repeat protein n=1 Tax=Novosphingobium tardum TaxID=1538021 RepID=A0ABV8RSX7_9SPHN
MRYTPAAVALSLLVAVSASVGHTAAPESGNAQARALLGEGRSLLASGNPAVASDAFEAALAVDPGYIAAYLALADAARAEGLQGKAIHYYREALDRDPNNLSALAGEGGAMAEKGAVEKARRNLAKLEGLCGKNCDEAHQLAAAIARGPAPHVLSAEAVTSEPVVTKN